MSYMISLSRYT